MREQGYLVPTPVQARAIPAILAGRDLLAAAQTGTGKTAGFTLPLLQHLAEPAQAGSRPVRALVIVPTRELAAQVAESVATYGRHLPLRCAVIFGGVGAGPQIAALRRGVDVLVATPGRLLDLMSQRAADLSKVEILVLDEADRMLDMGFLPDIRRVLARVPARRQTLMFSATFPVEIETLARTILDRPEQVTVAPRNATADNVDHVVYRVDRDRKTELLIELVRTGGWERLLVFTRTKHGANRLADKLERAGIRASAIHGNKSQGARTRALDGFRAGHVQALVATELAARGLDIDGLPRVVNFELPFVPEDYVHRIGRTARAGASGHAVSLVCVDENGLLRDIERVLRQPLPVRVIAGFEPDPRQAPVPLQRGGGGGARRGTPRRHTAPAVRRGGQRHSASREARSYAAR